MATKFRREDLPKGGNLCEHCTAKCCKYFALPIETPTDPEDFDFLRWYLLHDRASLFTEENEDEENDWYLLVHTTCKHLREDNLCGIYETRPQICRDYTTKNCEYEDEWTYDQYFETPEQIDEYTDALMWKKNSKPLRSRKPDLLPVIA
jgi:Fe-S-cluster containining protein